jgi:hypothetical protein
MYPVPGIGVWMKWYVAVCQRTDVAEFLTVGNGQVLAIWIERKTAS